jgi:anti-anti-sigma regulatory factor
MPSNAIGLPMDLDLRVEAACHSVTLHCQGQITAGETRDAFKATIVDLLQRNYEMIIVDLGGIHCLDRNGLATLVSLYSPARNAGKTLKYENLTVPVSDSRPSSQPFARLE